MTRAWLVQEEAAALKHKHLSPSRCSVGLQVQFMPKPRHAHLLGQDALWFCHHDAPWLWSHLVDRFDGITWPRRSDPTQIRQRQLASLSRRLSHYARRPNQELKSYARALDHTCAALLGLVCNRLLHNAPGSVGSSGLHVYLPAGPVRCGRCRSTHRHRTLGPQVRTALRAMPFSVPDNVSPHTMLPPVMQTSTDTMRLVDDDDKLLGTSGSSRDGGMKERPGQSGDLSGDHNDHAAVSSDVMHAVIALDIGAFHPLFCNAIVREL